MLEATELDQKPEPFVPDSTSLNGRYLRPEPPLPGARATLPKSTTPNPLQVELLSTSETTPGNDLLFTHPDNAAPANGPSDLSNFAERQVAIIPALPPPNLSAAHASTTTSVQPAAARGPMVNMQDISPNPLTDEQIDFVSRLSSTDLPPTDIARVIERMRAKVEGGQGLGSSGMGNAAGTDTAPPGYNALGD